jgi:hypothetical protein
MADVIVLCRAGPLRMNVTAAFYVEHVILLSKTPEPGLDSSYPGALT